MSERHDDPCTLNVGPGPFPLSIHHPVFPPPSHPDEWAKQDGAGGRPRLVARVLPSPYRVAVVMLAAVCFMEHSVVPLWATVLCVLYVALFRWARRTPGKPTPPDQR